MNNQKKATIGQILSIVQWVILIGLGIYFPKIWGWIIPSTMFVIHTLEAVGIGIQRGKLNGYTTLESLCLTWLYGFTWWKHLKIKKPEQDNHNQSSS